MVDLPDKVSPLDELAMPRIANGVSQVDLSERLCDSLVQIQAWPDTLVKVDKLVSSLGEHSNSMKIGPGRWLIESEEEGLEENLRSKISSNLGAVTGLTHARVVIQVKGAKAEWLLASGIALDFSLEAFPIASTQLSHHHEIGLTIHRVDENCFELFVFTSFARSFWKWLEITAAEVGYSVS